MKGKKIMALTLALALTLTAAACGNSEGSQKETKAPETTKTTEAKETEANDATEATQAPTEAGDEGETKAEQPSGGDVAYNVTWEDTADIVVLYPSMGPIPNGLQAVEDAMNEITEEEINTHVTLKMIEVGNYDQQVNLMTSSNEQLDLMITMPGGPASLSTMASQNQLTDITDLLPEYAPTALAGVGDLIKGNQINGRTLGFPTYKGFVGGQYINMRTDVLEDLGLMDKALNMKSFADFEEILEAVTTSEKWGHLAGVAATDGHGAVLPDSMNVCYAENFADCTFLDNLGNTQFAVAVREDGSNEVLNTFATEEFKKNYEIVKRWYDKGYVYKDSPTTKEMGTELVKSNVTFSHLATIEVGAEAAQDTNCGMDMTSVLITTKPITTSSLTKFVWAVPTTAKEPQAAITFLEMMFNDARIANLFAWGIEGTDYEVGDDGVAHFIEGNENPAYHAVAFLNANKFLVHPWDGDAPDINETFKKLMDEATYSSYLGFSGDTSGVTEEVSAITNAISEFQPQVLSGAADEATFQAFLDKLEVSGIDKLVAAYQEQLNTWLEATK